MPIKKSNNSKFQSTDKIIIPNKYKKASKKSSQPTEPDLDILSEMEDGLSSIEDEYPALAQKSSQATTRSTDLKAVLEISQAINSSLVLENILQKVMKHAIELLKAERGFLMLLDESGELQFKTVHNISGDKLMGEDFKISNSIANKVAKTGESIYTSDAQADEKYSKQKSIAELNLRSIMCVPLKIKEKIIGVVYLDNSSEAKVFLRSDLYLFELFTEQAAIAIENAKLYENLLRLKRYNENVVNKTPVGIVVVNDKFEVTSLNDAAFDILTPAERKNSGFRMQSSGRSFFEIPAEDQVEFWKKHLLHVVSTGRAFEESRFYYQVDDEEKVLNLKISPLEIEPQNSSGLIIVIEDTTEKVVLENYVMLSEKLVAKGEMAASIGHELNNYLAIISNSAELLLRNVKKQAYDKIDRNAEAIVESISKIKRFTDGLMDFSKLEKDPVSYDLRKLIEDILFSIKTHENFSRINFELQISHDIPPIEIDVGQIQQVLINGIYNSMEAINGAGIENGRIKIRAYNRVAGDQAETVVMEIVDNGPGIEVKHKDRIFEQGFTTKESGHGLGLGNCRRIIESHHGQLSIESMPEETVFKIVLPVKQPET
ncbi:MAG: GAF domain-containing protein [candidate division Zixibacteria bacterium]|nr:GAF domain-containing protein [candidate division Zixibacteria bacterium]